MAAASYCPVALAPLAIIFLMMPALLPAAVVSSSPVSSGSAANDVNGSSIDVAALLAFKRELSDPLGVLARSWGTNVSLCRWVGVSCSRRRQRVTALSLPDVPLQGYLTPHLGRNKLTGRIPSTSSNLSNLERFGLYRNQLTGDIPEFIITEYATLGLASCKSDVFSFGIMLLEVFTGKRPTDPMFDGELSIRKWVRRAFPAELISVTDYQILQDASCICNMDGFLSSIFEIGLICSSDSSGERMSMSNVVVALEKIKKDYTSSTSKSS